MGLVFCFLTNNLFFLLCSGVWYFVSNLLRVLTILVMKVWSLLFFTVAVSVLVCLLSLVLSDIRAGMVLEDKAWSRSELGNVEDTEGEALIDTLEEVEEASELSASSEAQKVQFDIARWYLLF